MLYPRNPSEYDILKLMQKGSALPLTALGGILIILIGLSGYYFYRQQQIKSINSFEDCAKLYPVMESYPEQCNTPDGKHFTRELSEEEKQKLNPSQDPVEDKSISWRNYDGEFFEGDYYKFKYPSNHKAQSGAYGCYPIIIKPTDKSIDGSICLVESTESLEAILNMGYGEKLLKREDITIKGHKGLIVEKERDRGSAISLTMVISDVPTIVGGEIRKKVLGTLSFTYDLNNPQDSIKARGALKQILETLEISE